MVPSTGPFTGRDRMRAPSAVAVTAIQLCAVAEDNDCVRDETCVDQMRAPSGETASVPALASPSAGPPTSSRSEATSLTRDDSAACTGSAVAIVVPASVASMSRDVAIYLTPRKAAVMEQTPVELARQGRSDRELGRA
jgi:hypothetical protein